MKIYGGMHVEIQIFLISALTGGECQLQAPAALPPGKEPPVLIG
jgi:hypothetical protein